MPKPIKPAPASIEASKAIDGLKRFFDMAIPVQITNLAYFVQYADRNIQNYDDSLRAMIIELQSSLKALGTPHSFTVLYHLSIIMDEEDLHPPAPMPLPDDEIPF